MNIRTFSELVDEKLDENSSAGAVSAAAIPATPTGVRSTQTGKKKKKAAIQTRNSDNSKLFI